MTLAISTLTCERCPEHVCSMSDECSIMSGVKSNLETPGIMHFYDYDKNDQFSMPHLYKYLIKSREIQKTTSKLILSLCYIFQFTFVQLTNVHLS